MVTIDSNVDLVLSYSSFKTLHTCPRKFELRKIHPIEAEREHSPAMSLGKAVGVGYATALELVFQPDMDYDNFKAQVLLETWRGYYPLLEDKIRTLTKAHCVVNALIDTPFTAYGPDDPGDWQLAEFNGVKATELSFCIRLRPDVVYVGYLDAVLYSPSTGDYRPLELKTTTLTGNLDCIYSNSLQGLAYGLVLDAITGAFQPEFVVHYRIAQLQKAKAMAYRPIIHDRFYRKSTLDRLEWLHTIGLECEAIDRYMEYELFPKDGDSCLAWNRPCGFYGICGLTNNPPMQNKDSNRDYQFYFEYDDLVAQSLRMVSGSN